MVMLEGDGSTRLDDRARVPAHRRQPCRNFVGVRHGGRKAHEGDLEG